MFEDVNLSAPGWGSQVEPTMNLIVVGVIISLLVFFGIAWLIIRER